MQEPKVRIVLLPVRENDNRKVAERYENSVFNTHEEARQALGEDVGICELTTFMDMCNDQDINLEQYWLTYIKINE